MDGHLAVRPGLAVHVLRPRPDSLYVKLQAPGPAAHHVVQVTVRTSELLSALKDVLLAPVAEGNLILPAPHEACGEALRDL